MVQIVGIIGGIASGKSLVSDCFARHGAPVCDADKLGHDALKDHAVKQALHGLWGDDIFDENGEIVRRSLGRIVFAPPPGGPEALSQLERIVHPVIGRQIERWAGSLPPGTPVAVLDAAVMLEAGWDGPCDWLIFVDAPVEQRLARAMDRGWTESGFHAREAAQLPLEEKRQRARWIIDNSGSTGQAIARAEQIWGEITSSGTNNPAAKP